MSNYLYLLSFTKTEMWLLAAAALMSCILGHSIVGRSMAYNQQQDNQRHPHDYEPILWASHWSWLLVPIYRIQKLIFVDIFSPAGAFAGIMTWIFIDQYLDLAKSSVWGTICVTALFLLAWTNFALPKYRPQFVDALITLIKAFATFVAGRWNPPGSSSSQQSSTVTSSKTTTSSQEPPIPINPGGKDDKNKG